MGMVFCCERCGCAHYAYTCVYSGGGLVKLCLDCKKQFARTGLDIGENEHRQKQAVAQLRRAYSYHDLSLAEKTKALIEHDRILRGEHWAFRRNTVDPLPGSAPKS